MQSEPPADDTDKKRPPAASPSEQPRIVHTDELFAGSREIWLQHGEQRYRLRITAAGKLILTK